jgi:hypothetical protein
VTAAAAVVLKQCLLASIIMSGESKSDDNEEEVKQSEESDAIEETWGDGAPQLLKEASLYWQKNSNYSQPLHEFCLSNSGDFTRYIDESDLTEVEHELHFADMHSNYLELYESQITDFCESRDVSVTEFFVECREAVDDMFCALFAENENKWFVELLLSALDYQKWFEMMVSVAKQSKPVAFFRQNGDEDDDDDDDGDDDDSPAVRSWKKSSHK